MHIFRLNNLSIKIIGKEGFDSYLLSCEECIISANSGMENVVIHFGCMQCIAINSVFGGGYQNILLFC